MNWLVVLVVSSIALGWLATPWWTFAVGPAVSGALGVYAVANEAPTYDMHGAGYIFGGIAAVVCFAAWLAARGLSAAARHRNRE